MTNAPTYRLAPAPKFAGMRTHDCGRCGRPEIKPVFLTDGTGGPVAYGSGCAARLLGRPETAARKVVDEFAAIQRAADQAEEMRVERVERYGRALAQFQTDPNVENGDLASARKTYHSLGGMPGLGMNFPAFMAAVAETGELPAV